MTPAAPRWLTFALSILAALAALALPAQHAHAQFCGAVITTSNQIVCAGDSVTLNAAITNLGGATVRWFRGTTLVQTGGTSYTIASAATVNSGFYTVRLTGGAFGCDETSAAVSIFVRADVVITTQPIGQTLCAPTNHTLTVAATGAGPLTYQWRRNGVNLTNGVNVNGTTISGATTPTLTFTSIDALDSGDYTCAVTNAGGCDTRISDVAILLVLATPSITTQPRQVTACEGTNVRFDTSALGGGLTYQWRRNGVNLVNGVNANGTFIANATLPSLTLGSIAPADAGAYSCLITNFCGSQTTVDAQLTVLGAIQFGTPPADRAACPGDTTSFTVTVSPTSAVGSYQWRRNGVNLTNGENAEGTIVAGATTPTLSLTSVAAGDAGTYSCVVSGPCGSSPSPAANLTVATSAPFITSVPQSASVCQGATHTFTCSFSTTTPATVQWVRGGVLLTNGPTGNGSTLSGVTTTSLTISNVQPGDMGSYSARVATVNSSGNWCFIAFSFPANLVVATPAITVSESTTVCLGANLTRTVQAPGATAFRWRRNGVNLNNGPQPGGGSLSGVTTSTLSISGITSTLGGDYTCAVTNPCGPVISPISTVSVTVGDPVSILASPSGQTITEGGSASFTVSAAGTGPLSFQWQRDNVDIADGASPNGTTIAGATTATLNLSAVSILDAGEFRCVVTNSCSSAGTLPALLTVNPAAPACSVADIVAIGGTPPPDGLLTGDDFVAFIAAFAAGDLLADIVAIGGTPPGDGLITGDDFNAFIAAFAAGCP